MFAGRTVCFSGLRIISKGFWPINFGIGLPDKRTGKFQSSCFFHHFVFVFMHCNRLQMQSFVFFVFSGLVSISLFSECIVWNSLGYKDEFLEDKKK